MKTISLLDLVGNDFIDAPFKIDDRPTNTDLLNRSDLIGILYNSLRLNFSDEHSNTIGLEGDWGSGKTSLINIYKNIDESNEFIILDESDCNIWLYENPLEIANCILRKISDNCSNDTNIKKEIKKVLKSLAVIGIDNLYSYTKLNLTSLNRSWKKEVCVEEQIKELQQNINKSNKSVVFFIENIDRCSSNIIISLFKLLGSILDIPNIVYVITYSEKRLNEIFNNTLAINPMYKDKIIKSVIHIPSNEDTHQFNLFYDAYKAAFEIYGLTINEQTKSIINVFANNTKDIRMLKRIINSAFLSYYNSKEKNFGMLIIDTIYFLNIDLWNNLMKRSYLLKINKPKNITETKELNKEDELIVEKYYDKEKDFIKSLDKEYNDFLHMLIKYFKRLELMYRKYDDENTDYTIN